MQSVLAEFLQRTSVLGIPLNAGSPTSKRTCPAKRPAAPLLNPLWLQSRHILIVDMANGKKTHSNIPFRKKPWRPQLRDQTYSASLHEEANPESSTKAWDLVQA